MPWVAHAPDAPDSHKMWTDPGSKHERVLAHIGWRHVVSAPEPVEPPSFEPPADPAPAEPSPVVESTAPEPKLKGSRRGAAVDRES